ncbi:MAG: hypothetical protein ABW224_00975 [Kibdelosporangium sp.]
MTVEEKHAWSMAVVSVVMCAVYLVIVLTSVDGGRLVDVPYVVPLLWTVGAAIVLTITVAIALNITAAVREPKGRLKDQRDLEIGRFGDHIGQSFVVIGGVTALILAMAEANHFWIANAIYLGFTLSAILGSIAKIAAYRWGFQ